MTDIKAQQKRRFTEVTALRLKDQAGRIPNTALPPLSTEGQRMTSDVNEFKEVLGKIGSQTQQNSSLLVLHTLQVMQLSESGAPFSTDEHLSYEEYQRQAAPYEGLV